MSLRGVTKSRHGNLCISPSPSGRGMGRGLYKMLRQIYIKNLHLPAIIGPMQKRLPLLFPTTQIPFPAILPNLRNMSFHHSPPFDLPRIVLVTATHIISAIPLKPSARIIFMNPTFLSPKRKRHASLHTKKIQTVVSFFSLGKLGMLEPALGKFLDAVTHIFPTKHSYLQHILGCQFRFEIRRKILPFHLGKFIGISLLHLVINDYDFFVFAGHGNNYREYKFIF
jgi:hypothetical protein